MSKRTVFSRMARLRTISAGLSGGTKMCAMGIERAAHMTDEVGTFCSDMTALIAAETDNGCGPGGVRYWGAKVTAAGMELEFS